jgi:hypothetical protein
MVGVPGSRLNILKNSVPTALVLFALGTAAASAYYTDMARAEDRISVAAMDFSTEGCGILADLAEEGQHLLPFSDGESFEISFKSVYNGNIDCIAVPRLCVEAEHFSSGDVIEITDGNGQCRMTDGAAVLCSEPFYCSPGDSVERSYRITVLHHEGDDPLLFDYDFTLAAAQAYANTELTDESGETVFSRILDDYEGVRDTVIGFTDLTGRKETRDLVSGMMMDERPRRHIVEVKPQIREGNRAEHRLRWYLMKDGAVRGPEEPASGVLKICLSEPDGMTAVRYEAANEAGIAASPVYEISIKGEEVQCIEKPYDPDYD